MAQLERIRTGLVSESDNCKLTVDQTANYIIIRLCDEATFAPGQATLLDAFKPVAERLKQTLSKEAGARFKITGHTDNTPIRKNAVRFPSNWHLSIERAQAVATMLQLAPADSDRVEVDGKGADIPIATNNTPEGRAKNRRVEIRVTRTD